MPENDIKAPKESFFISESIASAVDMSQFGAATSSAPEPDPILDASMIANIIVGASVFTVALVSCRFGGKTPIKIIGLVDSSFDPIDILNQGIDRIEIRFPSGKLHITDTSSLTPYVTLQPTDTNFVLTVNFEKNNLLIKG